MMTDLRPPPYRQERIPVLLRLQFCDWGRTPCAMKPEAKWTCMQALLQLIAAEKLLRRRAAVHEATHPVLWQRQLDGIRAELGTKFDLYRGKLTLVPLLRMLSPHCGINAALNTLPRGFPEPYTTIAAVRNAIAHGDWGEVLSRGGPRYALELATSFCELVKLCCDGDDHPLSVALRLGWCEWSWPIRPVPPGDALSAERLMVFPGFAENCKAASL